MNLQSTPNLARKHGAVRIHRGRRDRELPPAVVAKTKHHVLDTLAAILSGSRLRAGRLAATYVERVGGAAGGDADRHIAAGAGRKRGARQRHGRPCRRDRRLASRRAVSSRLRHRSGGACGRRAHRTAAAPTDPRGRARLRRRRAAHDVARLRAAPTRRRTAPTASAPRSAPRRRGRAAAVRPARVRHVLSYAASRRPAVRTGTATASTSKRPSTSAAWARATASPAP